MNIGAIEIYGFQAPSKFIGLKNSTIRNINIKNFRTGVYIQDCINTLFDGANISGTSPSAPGNNGCLIVATIENFSVANLTINNWTEPRNIPSGSAVHYRP